MRETWKRQHPLGALFFARRSWCLLLTPALRGLWHLLGAPPGSWSRGLWLDLSALGLLGWYLAAGAGYRQESGGPVLRRGLILRRERRWGPGQVMGLRETQPVLLRPFGVRLVRLRGRGGGGKIALGRGAARSLQQSLRLEPGQGAREIRPGWRREWAVALVSAPVLWAWLLWGLGGRTAAAMLLAGGLLCRAAEYRGTALRWDRRVWALEGGLLTRRRAAGKRELTDGLRILRPLGLPGCAGSLLELQAAGMGRLRLPLGGGEAELPPPEIRPPLRSILRYVGWPLAAGLLPFLLPLAGLEPVPGDWMWLVLPVLAALGFFHTGIGIQGNRVVVCRGRGLWAERLLIPAGLVRQVELRRSLLQRLGGECDLLLWYGSCRVRCVRLAGYGLEDARGICHALGVWAA